MNGVSGRLDEFDYLADTCLACIAAFGGNSRFQIESHQAKQRGLQNVIVIVVQRAIHEDVSIEITVLWQRVLSARSRRLGPAGITFANAAIWSVDEHFAALIADDPSSDLDRFLLGVEVARNPFSARFVDRPSLPARNNMLVLGRHWLVPRMVRQPMYHDIREGTRLHHCETPRPGFRLWPHHCKPLREGQARRRDISAAPASCEVESHHRL